MQSIKNAMGGGADSSAESIVTFQELPFLVPRGRYEVDLYMSSMRLRGKSYDYKIPYSNIVKLFLLPKPDDVHVMLVVRLQFELRSGHWCANLRLAKFSLFFV